jgi:hypothetical protein
MLHGLNLVEMGGCMTAAKSPLEDTSHSSSAAGAASLTDLNAWRWETFVIVKVIFESLYPPWRDTVVPALIMPFIFIIEKPME